MTFNTGSPGLHPLVQLNGHEFSKAADAHLELLLHQLLVAEDVADAERWLPIVLRLASDAAQCVLPAAAAAFGEQDPRFYVKASATSWLSSGIALFLLKCIMPCCNHNQQALAGSFLLYAFSDYKCPYILCVCVCMCVSLWVPGCLTASACCCCLKLALLLAAGEAPPRHGEPFRQLCDPRCGCKKERCPPPHAH